MVQEAVFLTDSYGYRPRKSALDAVGVSDFDSGVMSATLKLNPVPQLQLTRAGAGKDQKWLDTAR